jgi:hypothetical protein
VNTRDLVRHLKKRRNNMTEMHLPSFGQGKQKEDARDKVQGCIFPTFQCSSLALLASFDELFCGYLAWKLGKSAPTAQPAKSTVYTKKQFSSVSLSSLEQLGRRDSRRGGPQYSIGPFGGWSWPVARSLPFCLPTPSFFGVSCAFNA